MLHVAPLYFLWVERTARPDGNKMCHVGCRWAPPNIYGHHFDVACAEDTVRTDADSAGERPTILHGRMDPNTFFFASHVTNDHEQPRFVPPVPMRFGRTP